MGVEESLEYHVMAAFRTRVLVCLCACMCAHVNIYTERDTLIPSKSGSKRQLNADTVVQHKS